MTCTEHTHHPWQDPALMSLSPLAGPVCCLQPAAGSTLPAPSQQHVLVRRTAAAAAQQQHCILRVRSSCCRQGAVPALLPANARVTAGAASTAEAAAAAGRTARGPGTCNTPRGRPPLSSFPGVVAVHHTRYGGRKVQASSDARQAWRQCCCSSAPPCAWSCKCGWQHGCCVCWGAGQAGQGEVWWCVLGRALRMDEVHLVLGALCRVGVCLCWSCADSSLCFACGVLSRQALHASSRDTATSAAPAISIHFIS